MANIPKADLKRFVNNTRIMLQYEKHFRDTHDQRHYQEFVKRRNILQIQLEIFDKLELQNIRQC